MWLAVSHFLHGQCIISTVRESYYLCRLQYYLNLQQTGGGMNQLILGINFVFKRQLHLYRLFH